MHTGTLILGTGSLARKVASELQARANGRERLLGVVSEAVDVCPQGFPCPHVGSVAELAEIIASATPERVVIAPRRAYQYLPLDRLVETQVRDHIVVETGTEAFERLTGKLAIESLPGHAVLFSNDFRPAASALAFGRLVSIAGALAGLLLTLPLMALIAVAIRLDSPGPALFIQERIGLGGRKFNLYKFRSMSAEQIKHSE
ncbi:MAG: sugar transferase, partial [Gammaproteobacteria bacterium]